MGCAIFSLKLIPQTVEAEITAVMPSQRACDAENQARYTLSNGPLRVQRNAFYAQSILQRVGIRQLPGDMMVSPPSARVTVNSRWHRGSFVSLVSHSSLTDCTVLSGALLFGKCSFGRTPKELFFFRRSLIHILPPLETVKDIAATQQYDVLPLSCEILSDFITPIEAMRILKNVSTHCYMLESAQADDRWGRYTFLGFDPKLEITCIDGKMKAGGLTVRTDDPSQYLRELLSSYRSPRFDYLPSFAGGLVGYFSYDYLKYSEPSVRCGEQDEDSFKDVDLMLFDKVIAFDHVRQKIVLIVNMALSDVEVGYNKAKLELEQLVSLLKTGEKKQEAPGRLLGEVTPLFSK